MQARTYLDRKSEAERLKISVRTLDRHVKDDGFPFIRFGNRLLFDPALSDEFLAARTFRGRAAELAQAA